MVVVAILVASRHICVILGQNNKFALSLGCTVHVHIPYNNACNTKFKLAQNSVAWALPNICIGICVVVELDKIIALWNRYLVQKLY